MATGTLTPPIGSVPDQLNNGDRLTQREFHALYERMPPGTRAELIGGIVYVASPLKLRHGRNHSPLGALLFAYEDGTEGTESSDNTTVILNEENEPQPDLFLRVLPEYGGRSETTGDDYVDGPPELVAEVADSSRSIDLNRKRAEYAAAGVVEYLIVDLRDRRFHWFDLVENRELSSDPDGVIRVRVFPGLWIDVEAVLARKFRRSLATLDRGLATPEHAAFVAKLAAAKK